MITPVDIRLWRGDTNDELDGLLVQIEEAAVGFLETFIDRGLNDESRIEVFQNMQQHRLSLRHTPITSIEAVLAKSQGATFKALVEGEDFYIHRANRREIIFLSEQPAADEADRYEVEYTGPTLTNSDRATYKKYIIEMVWTCFDHLKDTTNLRSSSIADANLAVIHPKWTSIVRPILDKKKILRI